MFLAFLHRIVALTRIKASLSARFQLTDQGGFMAAPVETLPQSADLKNSIKEDPKKNLRDKVNLLLPDSLMIVLAIIMVPIILVRLLLDLPTSVADSMMFLDYTILAVFIVEYISKAALAQDIRRHVLNPWRVLDLLVILLPFFDLLQFVGGFARWSPILRLLRITRLIAVGGRAVSKMKQKTAIFTETPVAPPMTIRVVDGTLENVQQDVPLGSVGEYLESRAHTWINISSVSDTDFNELSKALKIPSLVLESELVEESYPRIDYFENHSMIFARIANITMLEKGSRRMVVNRFGLLVICWGDNIITLSKANNNFFSDMLEKAEKYHTADEPLVVSVLYTILKYTLEKDKLIIRALEQEILKLESIPLKERPSDFLENTFHLKKEVNQLVPSLLHKREITSMITSKRVPLEGFVEKHERLFDILTDEATYLQETAENARENLLSLIDLYINTTSFELNKVMRIIAVITCLGIIPALGGLFGSNILGNPWPIELWQLFGIIVVLELILAWVFYRLGWLKG
jgi:Mg2+ and Co2+ transporter CorA